MRMTRSGSCRGAAELPRCPRDPPRPGGRGALCQPGTAAAGRSQRCRCLAVTCQASVCQDAPEQPPPAPRWSQTGSRRHRRGRHSRGGRFSYSLGQISASLAVMLLLQAKHMVMPETVMVVKRCPLV